MSKNDDSLGGWIIGIGILALVIFSFSSFSNSNYELAQEEKEESITKVIRDIDDRYSELSGVAESMIQDIDEQCVWQSDNLSESIGDYCANALEDYAYINSSGWTAESVTYNDEDTTEEIVSILVSEANSQYDELLDRSSEAADRMDGQCAWLLDNISSDTADYCYDTISEFSSASFSSAPFSLNDYSEYFINE